MAPVQPLSQSPFPPASIAVPVPPAAVVVPAPPSSLFTRTQRFIEENQRLILLGCAILAASGTGYYLYNRPSSSSSSGGRDGAGSASGSTSPTTPGGTTATGAAKKKNKKSKKKTATGGASGLQSGFLKGEGTDGPLIEEIQKPEAAGQAGSAEKSSPSTAEAAVSGSADLNDVPDQEVLAKMSDAVSGPVAP